MGGEHPIDLANLPNENSYTAGVCSEIDNFRIHLAKCSVLTATNKSVVLGFIQVWVSQ